MERLTFKVDMSYICELARTQLWDESRPIEQVLELLYSIMGGGGLTEEQKYILAIEILEGRKIIVGINEGTVVEDNREIRPIGLLIQKKQAKIDYYELELHMDVAPLWYVDSFVGGRSIRDPAMRHATRERVIWLKQRVGFDDHVLPDHPLDWGCYLLLNPRFAYNVLGGPARSHAEVLDKLTIYWNKKLQEWKDQGLTYSTMNDYQKAVYDRNWMACGNKRRGNPENAHLYIHPFEDEINARLVRNAKWVAEQAQKSRYCDTQEEYVQYVQNKNQEVDGYKFHGQPDEPGKFYSHYAWISPEGLWYSADFGGHEIKAEHIVAERADIAEKYAAYKEALMAEKQFTDETYRWRYEQKIPMFFLQEVLHWAMLRDVHNVGMVQVDSHVELNDLQLAAIRNMVNSKRLDYNPITGEDIHWDDLEGDED